MTLTRHWIPLLLAGCVWTGVAAGQTGAGSGTGLGGFGGTGSGTGTGTGTTRGSGTTAPRSGMSSANQAATESGAGTTGTGTQGTGTGTGNTGTGTGPDGTNTGRDTRPSGTTTPPSDPFGFGPPPSSSDPFGFGSPATPPGTAPATSPFGTRTPGASTTFGAETRGTDEAAGADTPAAETGAPGPTAPGAEPESVTAPTFYGKPGQVFTPGQGRFARPRFRYSASTGIGFDDNTQQTPDREDIEDQVIRQVIPAQPEVAVIQTERILIGQRFVPNVGFVPLFRNVERRVVLRPAVPEQVIETPIPGLDFAERNASIVSRLDLGMDVQWANAREVFTFDLNAGAEYYWNRDKDPLEFNGNLSTTYIRKFGPRAQFTGNLYLAYLSQPDYSQVNLVDAPGSGGSYFVGNLKLDLSYKWAARFSTVTSLSGNTIQYQGNRSGSSYWEAALGNEFRYIQSRRTTWVAELRYSQLQYLEAATGAVDTLFLLLGSDWQMSRRFRTTLRLGEALRTFETGGKASSPYAEIGAVYQPTRRDQFSLNGRYGFEQTSNASDETVAARISAAYTRTFTPRFLGSLNANYVKSSTEFAGGISSESEIFDGSLLFQYTFSRKFSMNARYSYTFSKSSNGLNNYDRNRIFLTGQYEF